ncbi:MAG TPA: hypothetical protein VF174_04720 [Micromonosporaceae bacterium]
MSVAALVGRLTYKPGWTFKLGGPGGRYLCVFATTPDSNDVSRQRTTQHMFEVPDDLTTDRAAARWIFERLLLVEQHEAGEFFAIAGRRPFYPHHQDEGSPYDLVDRWEEISWS